MEFEGRLTTTDDVPTIMSKIFPPAGGMDEAEFNKVVDPNDRTMIYQSVRDTDTRVRRTMKSCPAGKWGPASTSG